MSAARSPIDAGRRLVGQGPLDEPRPQQLRLIRYDYYRDDDRAFEAFKAGEIDIRQENIARNWATAYDIPAGQGRAHPARRDASTRAAADAVLRLQPPARAVQGPPRARGDRPPCSTSHGPTRTCRYGLLTRDQQLVLRQFRARPPPACRRRRSSKSSSRCAARSPTRSSPRSSSCRRPTARGNIREAGAPRHRAPQGGRLGDQGRQDDRARHGPEARLRDACWASRSFERIALPFKQNLRSSIGIDMRVRTVDTAQYQRRKDDFDFDMIDRRCSASRCRRATSSASSGAPRPADTPGSRNTIGIADPAIDRLIELVIAAPDRESLVSARAALDRVLLWHHYRRAAISIRHEFWSPTGTASAGRRRAPNTQPRGLSTPGGSTRQGQRAPARREAEQAIIAASRAAVVMAEAP